MNTAPLLTMRRVTPVLLALLLIPLLISGCGGLASLAGDDGPTGMMQAMGLGTENYIPLTDLSPSLTQGWQSDPVVAAISINGHAYNPALKAAVNGDVATTGLTRYHLAGLYSAFAVVFGVTDDEPDSPSWTAFRFWGDGHEIATPHYVKKGERRTIFVDTRGVQDLDLIAEGIPQTDGFIYGPTHVGWGDASLIKETGITYLVDLTPTSTPGWSVPPVPGTVWINWRPFPHAVTGTIYDGQPAARSIYNLGGLYKSFATVAGISQNETDATAQVTFEVLADGVTIGAATTLAKQAEKLFQLDVTGVNTLEVRAQVSSATESAIDIGWGMALVAVN